MAKKRAHNSRYLLLKTAILIAVVLLALLYPSKGGQKSNDGNDKLGIELAIPQFTKSTKSQVIEHVGYTVSYNEQRRNPNWVAYELTSEEVDGTEPRGSKFIPDPSVAGRQAVDNDYRNSGWDRGHLAPAADMKWSEQAMRECFYLSNICPQDHKLNTGTWKTLEEKCREYARYFGNVYIVCGPIVKNNKYGNIGENGVMVPDGFYKVLLTTHYGKYTGVGFLFDNAKGSKRLADHAVTIDEVERVTGIDFFHALPDDTETAVESRIDKEVWGL